jgi:hypothetical protein
MGETMRQVRRLSVRTALAVLSLAGMAPLHASRLDPVTWSLEAQQTQAAPGSTVMLRLHAQIAGGYHLYSFTTPVGGPIKTRASLEFSPDIKAIQIYQPAPDHHEDQNLHAPVETFQGGVDFLLRTTLADSARAGAKFVTATVRYQACSNQICLAPVTKVATASISVQPGAATVKVSIPTGYQLVDESAGHVSEKSHSTLTDLQLARAETDELYRGWLDMYDLNFEDAHQRISLWEATHPESAMGPTSQATAYLFAELARLGVLESELFVDDARFRNRERFNPDPEAKRLFMEQIREADDLASHVLAVSPGDVDALLAESIALGLRADYDSLIEKKMLTPLEYTKRSREYAERLLSVDSDIYDAYLGPGVENYILSQKAAPVRFFLRLKGAQVDHDKGIDSLEKTSAHGYYLEPFAKLLLAVAALRDNNPGEAARLLRGLHQRFPHNSLYVRELDRIARSG